MAKKPEGFTKAKNGLHSDFGSRLCTRPWIPAWQAPLATTAVGLQAALNSVEGLKQEAAQARAMAERHQEMVASLTADNLMFVMRLKQCEGELVSASQERDELRLAVDQQKGPWFEEVWIALETKTHREETALPGVI